MLLSICVPTYNRGHRVINIVNQFKEISKKYPDDVELIISNNCSTKYTDEYKAISEMKINNFTYSKNDANLEFLGNMNKLVKLSKGDFCLFISDEDTFVIDALDFYIDFMRNNPNIGLIRSMSNVHYSGNIEEYLQPGKELISSFFLKNNYISGIIYNRKILTNEVVDILYNRYKDGEGYKYYPHMFFDTMLLLTSPFYRSDKLLIIEEKGEGDLAKRDGLFSYAVYESRIAQMKNYCEFVQDLSCPNGIQLQMIMEIINKTVFLNYLVKNVYMSMGTNWENRKKQMSTDVKEILNSLEMSVVKNNITDLYDYVDALINYSDTKY